MVGTLHPGGRAKIGFQLCGIRVGDTRISGLFLRLRLHRPTVEDSVKMRPGRHAYMPVAGAFPFVVVAGIVCVTRRLIRFRLLD